MAAPFASLRSLFWAFCDLHLSHRNTPNLGRKGCKIVCPREIGLFCSDFTFRLPAKSQRDK